MQIPKFGARLISSSDQCPESRRVADMLALVTQRDWGLRKRLLHTGGVDTVVFAHAEERPPSFFHRFGRHAHRVLHGAVKVTLDVGKETLKGFQITNPRAAQFMLDGGMKADTLLRECQQNMNEALGGKLARISAAIRARFMPWTTPQVA